MGGEKGNQEHWYEAMARLFTPEQPKLGLGAFASDFLQAEPLNKGRRCIEQRPIQTSTQLNDDLDRPGIGQVYRLERCFRCPGADQTGWISQCGPSSTMVGRTCGPGLQPADLLNFTTLRKP